MKKTWIIWPAMISLCISMTACNNSKSDRASLSPTVYSSEEVPASEPVSQTTEAAIPQNEEIWTIPEDYVGTWSLDTAKTEQNLQNHTSLVEMFGTGLGSYGASIEISEDGSFSYFIGIGVGGSGQCEKDGKGIHVSITPFQDTGDYEKDLYLKNNRETVSGQETAYLVMRYGQEELYWILDTDGPNFGMVSPEDGTIYEKVRDLSDGFCHWASVLTAGDPILDDHGHETTDYNTQKRSFVCLDDGRRLEVRRWDNLNGSAGDYLIYEYDGITHVSKSDDLYHPVLSLKDSSFGTMDAVPDGYMIAGSCLNEGKREYTVTFYDKDFQPVRVIKDYRTMENGNFYEDGLMAVRDMTTGLMGFMDQKGDLAIPCKYGYVSDFSNGYASVLTDATLVPFTEESGTVPMFDAEGGQWGIIDTNGSFVVEASEQFANQESENPNEDWFCGARRFSPVRKDKTVDFLASDENDRILATVQIP